MKKTVLSDKELAGIFEKDAANIIPDASIRENLEYTYMVKSANHKTTQNSFTGMFFWLFSWSQIPLKAALVSVVLLVSLINFQPKNSELITPACDTTQNRGYHTIDSSGIIPFYADSCFKSKS